MRKAMSFAGGLLLVASALRGAPGAANQPAAETAPPAVSTASATPVLEVPADQSRQKAYSHGRYALYFVNVFWGMLVLYLLLTTGLSARLRELAAGVSHRNSIVVFLYTLAFVLFTSVVSFPLDFYGGYIREKRYGFAHQTPLGWMGDWAKALAVGIVFGGIFAVVVYAVIRKFPRGYWLGASAAAILFVVFTMAVFPVFIAPLFNKFKPLQPGPLKQRLLEMAHAQRIPAREVFEVDASRQSGHTNAYVAGFLGTQRIVLYDTILKTDTPGEIFAVMGHEMGHYVLNHLWKGIALISLSILFGAWLIKTLFAPLAARHPEWGFREVSDPAGLPLILLILSVYQFVLTPADSGFSRAFEHQADAFSLEVTRDPDSLASAFRKFNTVDLSELDPPPWIEFWLYSHPSLRHRVEFCEQWKREHSGS
jgi:STE24 endopeptidase